MSLLLCRRLLRLRLRLRTLATAASTESHPTKLSSSSSFTVDFLTTSCGLTPAQALSAASSIHFDEKRRQQPESVVALLRFHGFSDAQIAEVVARLPRVLLCRAEKNLAPKLQFLTAAGLSSELIVRYPGLLLSSLEGRIRPCFEFLRGFLGSAEAVRTLYRRNRWCLDFDLKTTMIPNTGLLLELGVAAAAIGRLMMTQPWALKRDRERFAEIVKIVQDWGVKPDQNNFLHAVRALCGLGESTLAARLELFKKLGWSDEEVMSAFRRSPLCILASERKIMRMNSFSRKLGLGPSDLSRRPSLLMYGFDKRILPRYAVWQVLTAEGLIKQGTNKVVAKFHISEKLFRDRYVTRYMDKVPELMDVYLGKIKVEGGLDVGGEKSRST